MSEFSHSQANRSKQVMVSLVKFRYRANCSDLGLVPELDQGDYVLPASISGHQPSTGFLRPDVPIPPLMAVDMGRRFSHPLDEPLHTLRVRGPVRHFHGRKHEHEHEQREEKQQRKSQQIR